jgi:hypothetical protein
MTASQRHLFIGGLHRSGTSLLHRLLRAHPQISGFIDTGTPEDEGQHLQSVFPVGMAFGGPGRFGFDPRAYMDENHPLATRENAATLAAEWRRHWDMTKPVLVEKTPLNLVRMRFLQALFPDARFIVILRHPVVVAFATWKFTGLPIPHLIEHNLRVYERALADMLALRHMHVLHYELLVAEPQRTLDRIWQFAGVGDSPVIEVPDQGSNAVYFAQWQSERANIAAAEGPRWLDGVEARCRAIGYTLKDAEPIGRD